MWDTTCVVASMVRIMYLKSSVLANETRNSQKITEIHKK